MYIYNNMVKYQRLRISKVHSLGSFISKTGETTQRKDSQVPLMHHAS